MRRRTVVTVLPPALACVALIAAASTHIASRPLWLDEGFSAALASAPWREFAGVLVHGEINMSSYYLLLRAFTAVGHSELVVRLPSLLAALLTVGYLHRIARARMRPLAAATTVLFFAVNPVTIHFAMEARSYTLAMLCATAASSHLLDGLSGSRRAWGWWAVWAVIGVFAHTYVLFVLVAQAVAALVAWRRVGRRDALPAAAVTAAAAAGFLVLLVRGHSAQNGWIAPLTLRQWLVDATWFAGMQRHHLGRVALVLALVGLAAALARRRVAASAGVLLVGWLLLPLAIATAVSVWHQPILSPRYLVVSTPALALALGVTIDQLDLLPVRMVAAVAALAVATQAGVLDVRYSEQVENVRGAVAVIARDTRPGDALVTLPQYYRVLVDWYADRVGTGRFHNLAAVIPPVPLGTYGDHLGTLWPAARPPDTPYGRVWLIRRTGGDTLAQPRPAPQLHGVVADWICSGRRLTQQWLFRGILVQLFAPGSGGGVCR